MVSVAVTVTVPPLQEPSPVGPLTTVLVGTFTTVSVCVAVEWRVVVSVVSLCWLLISVLAVSV